MTMRQSIGLAVTVAMLASPLALVASGSAPGTEATANAPATTAAPAAEPALEAAKIAIDPQTGETRALTASEEAALRSQMKAFWDRFAAVPHVVKADPQNGWQSYVVAPTRMRVAVATVAADGTTAWDCTGQHADPDAVAAALRAKLAAAPAAPEEK